VGATIIGLCDPAWSASNQLLKVDTRYGAVVVTRAGDDCCKANIVFHDQKKEIVSAGELYATREGLFQTAEGDLVVLSTPTGARGMPPNYWVLLISASSMADIGDKNFFTADGTFGMRQLGNEIEFDLGWENRKHKIAFYRAGVIYVGSDNAKPAPTLAKKDCAYVLNTLADCRKSCPEDGFMSLAVQRNLVALDEKPVFKSDRFFKICKDSCTGAAFSTPDARKQLCGY
jgi:hypothetical protein